MFERFTEGAELRAEERRLTREAAEYPEEMVEAALAEARRRLGLALED